MTPRTHAITRRTALLGSSAALVLLLAATGAQAQTSGATATAPRSLASTQTATGNAFADASDTVIRSIVTGSAEDADIRLEANLVSAAARANGASLTLPGDALDDAAADAPAAAAGPSGAAAEASIAIAARQSMGAVTAQSDMIGSQIWADLEAPVDSRVTISANALETRALGNDLSALLGLDSGAGAAIATSQSTATGSNVSASSRGAYGLVTGDTQSSTLGLIGNLDRATATGNRAASTLTVNTATVQMENDAAQTSVVPVTTGSDATSRAIFALATHQSAGGTVQATTAEDTGGHPFTLLIKGRLADSSAALDANTIVTAVQGNDAGHAITLIAGSIEPASVTVTTPGAIAAITNVQKAPSLRTLAFTGGGAQMTIRQDASNSDLSASGNIARTLAGANRSENSLALTAASVDVPRGPGQANVDADGLATADAGLSLHNVQDFGLSTVSATHGGSQTGIIALAGLDGVHAAISANDQGVRAAGNDTSNRITAETGSLASSVGINSLQTGNGEVGAMLGAVAAPSGAVILKSGPVEGSVLAASDNRLASTAIGNAGTNEIDIASGLFGGTGGDAVSGPISNAYGAGADVALASNQKLGESIGSTTVTPIIRGRMASQFGVTGPGDVTNSLLIVADNRQQASAIGNSGVNHLAVTANLSEGATAPTTALASSQYGQAAIDTVSRAQFVIEGSLATSEARISGNSNAALGAINDADNRLEVTGGVEAAATRTATVSSDAMGPPSATGGHVLTSQQFASGSVNATAVTQIGDLSANTSLNSGSYAIAGNRTEAEASSNRATNLVRADIPGAGLVSTQVNLAASTASALGSVTYRATAPGAIQDGSLSIDGNSITAIARGNTADNRLEFGRTATGAPAESVSTRFDAGAEGSAALVNAQSNYGRVIASAIDTSLLVALNDPSAGGSSFGLTNNAVTATAYGNIASNSVTQTGVNSSAGLGIANLQTNSGNITANVTRASAGFGATTLPGTVSLSGNQLSATAVGNQATSAIASPR